jgi:PAS domain S-box-containing protein
MLEPSADSKYSPLRRKLVLPLLWSGALIAFAMSLAIYYPAQRQLQSELHQRAEVIAHSINYAAEVLTYSGELQRIVTSIGAESDLLDIVVIGGHPSRVLATTRNSWRGRLLSELPDQRFFATARHAAETGEEQHYYFAEQGVFELATPLMLSRPVLAERGSDKGAILVRLDTRWMMAQIRSSMRQLLALTLIALGSLAILGYLRLQAVVLRPLQRIGALLSTKSWNSPQAWQETIPNDELGRLAETLRKALREREAGILELENQKFALDQHSIVARTDLQGRITYVNELFCQISGYTREELLGQTHRMINSGTHPKEFFQELWRTIGAGGVWRGEICNRAKTGELYWVDSTIIPLIGADGKPKSYIAIRTDISDIRAAQRQAEEANRMKSEFLANMSHELRTPLNGVIGMTQLLAESSQSQEQGELIQDLDTSARALLAVINDILDISKVEAGKLALSPAPFKLEDLLTSSQRVVTLQAQKKRISLAFPPPKTSSQYYIGDAGRLQQVLLNLLANALKFTPPDGAIVVQVDEAVQEATHSELHFSVADSGVGIPPEKRGMIFEPFVQADGSITRRFGGTGLGLSISRRLVDLMGGKIWVESREGVGSTFHFTARTSPCSAPEESLQSAQLLSHTTPQSTFASHRRLLLVEDNPVNQRVTLRLLERMGYLVEIAGDGKEALELVRLEPDRYALIFMDCQMPVMDGFSATRAIRELESQSGRRVPIVAMTASAMESDIKKCIATGMDGFIAKPIDIELVRSTLARFLTPTRAEQDGTK